MASDDSSTARIATSSVEDGLDFAGSLIADAIAEEGRANPESASELLRDLTSYIRSRYVGEFALALEYLISLGRVFPAESPRGRQFWAQLRWVARKMELTIERLKSLEFRTKEKPNKVPEPTTVAHLER